MSNEKHQNVTKKMLEDGLNLETGVHHVLHLVGDRLHLKLGVDPSGDSTEGEKFTLIGLRGRAREYEQTRTTQDDVDPGDEFWEVVFTDLVPDLTYSLEVDPGDQVDQDEDDNETAKQDAQKRTYLCFEGVPLTKLESALEP